MPNIMSPILGPIGLDPSKGYDTAAAGARQAQQQANALSDLQWQRQMAGLQQAQGAANQFQSLFNSVYGGPQGGGMSAMSAQPSGGANMLLPKTPQAPAPSGGGMGGLLQLSPAYQIYQHWTKPVVEGAAHYAAEGAQKAWNGLKGLF